MSQFLMPPVAAQPENTSNLWTMYDNVSNHSQVIAANYLAAQQAAGHVFQPQDFMLVNYVGGSGLFSLSFSGNIITLVPAAVSSSVYQQVIGLNSIIMETAGTWTRTQNATGDYSLVHTAAANTPIISWDITPAIQLSANLGFQLASIDFIHQIGTIALNSHSATLNKVTYANNVANAITNIPLTGSLSTAIQTNPYVDNLAVTTPAFLNTAVSKYVVEQTANCQSTTAFQIYGLNLHFAKTA